MNYEHNYITWVMYKTGNDVGTLEDINLDFDDVVEKLGGKKEDYVSVSPGDISFLLWEKFSREGVTEVEFFYN